jgi:hypothetical protein
VRTHIRTVPVPHPPSGTFLCGPSLPPGWGRFPEPIAVPKRPHISDNQKSGEKTGALQVPVDSSTPIRLRNLGNRMGEPFTMWPENGRYEEWAYFKLLADVIGEASKLERSLDLPALDYRELASPIRWGLSWHNLSNEGLRRYLYNTVVMYLRGWSSPKFSNSMAFVPDTK